MIYGVIGPRDYNRTVYEDYQYVERALATFKDMTKLVSGGGAGIETLAERYAVETELEHFIIRPNLKQHERDTAFFLRNTDIIEASDALIVFWDGHARTVLDFIAQAMKLGKECNVIPMGYYNEQR